MNPRRPLIALLLAAALAPAAGAESPKAAGPPKPKPITPPTAQAIDKSIARGVDFLVARQGKGGWWGACLNTKGLNIYAPVPGAHHAFRSATTGLCVSALIESGDQRPAVRKAIEAGGNWLAENLPTLRRARPRAIYNNWGHAFGIQALVRLTKRAGDDSLQRERFRKLIQDQIELLGRYECVNGGWGYYDFRWRSQKPGGGETSFTTATVLVALREAQSIGVLPPGKLVERGLAALRRMRNPDSTYLYSYGLRWRPAVPINRSAGSLGRSQACNYALRVWEDPKITDAVLKEWLDRLSARNFWLSIGRKRPVPHESHAQVAGYFYYYGHYYAGMCLDQLPAADRPHFQGHLAHILLRLQEKDGSWWDYPLYDYHQQYGTAMAIMSLTRCRPAKK
jgi:hypothetical protein